MQAELLIDNFSYISFITKNQMHVHLHTSFFETLYFFLCTVQTKVVPGVGYFDVPEVDKEFLIIYRMVTKSFRCASLRG